MNRSAWSDYWSGGGSGAGCLPEAMPAIESVQRQTWQSAALAVRRNGRVLDLATGDGVVLRHLAKARPDLKLVGVDNAERLPPAPSGITLRAGVAIERLPFPDARFDLVTSQFGLEYGDVAKAAHEIRRVLAAAGALWTVVHHQGSGIVAHNLARREALHWATREADYLAKARALAVARKWAPFLPVGEHFRAAPQEARRRFPTQPVTAEIATAIHQTLAGGLGRPPQEAIEILATLERRAANEIARIDALEQAARDETQIGELADVLNAAGLEVAPPQALCEAGTGRPFAWLVRSASAES